MTPDDILRKHVLEERKFYSNDVFKQLQKRYPVDPDDRKGLEVKDGKVKLYRGLNFKTKTSHDEFIETVGVKGYQKGAADSWSPSYDEAYGFSMTAKSFYMSDDMIASYSDAQEQHEVVSGYGGLVLEAWIDLDRLVDVNASDYGVEDEILLEPSCNVAVSKINQVKTFRRQIEDGDIDLNVELARFEEESFLGYKDVDDSKFYLHAISQHLNDIHLSTSDEVFDRCMDNYMKTLNSFRTEEGETFVPADADVGAYITDRDNTWEEITEGKEKQLNAVLPYSLIQFYQRGLFTKEQSEQVVELLDEITDHLIGVSYETGISTFGNSSNYLMAFASKPLSDALFRQANLDRGREYIEIMNSVDDINKLSGDDFENGVADFQAALLKTVKAIGGSVPKEHVIDNNPRDKRRVKPRPL